MPYNLTTMQSIFCNNKEITEIRCNGSLVYQKQSGPDYTEPFYVENISNADETLSIVKDSSAPTLTIEYKTDNNDWAPLVTTSTTAFTRTLLPGDKIYLRCNGINTQGIKNNTIRGVSKVGGNIMSLLYGSNFTGEETTLNGTSHTFEGLFYNNKVLKDAVSLLLPATTLAGDCYSSMFRGCTALITTPLLPATTLTGSCYSLMFHSCTSLVNAPYLPATTVVNSCYSNMFTNCTSLTTSPVLPATTLAISCYYYMFSGCISLNTVKCLATDRSASSATSSWLSGVSSTGTFYKAAGATWPTGNYGIPSGWTVVEV